MVTNVLYGEPICDYEYRHSSNSLFHFMKKPEYMNQILKTKKMYPRYCKEDVKYLSISLENEPFDEVAILQTCFCDIPLHRITDTLKCSVNIFNKGKNHKENRLYSHTDLYGEYAIALTKSWGERTGIQPIHYINENSFFCDEMKQAINEVISTTENINETVSNNYLSIISHLKPLRGEMIRSNDNEGKEIVSKNFHDEHEWRFVPKYIEGLYEPVIASSCILNEDENSQISIMSNKIAEDKYEKYWLSLNYTDIKYIIVPNNTARLEVIEFVMSLSENVVDQYLLISKILVLEEIRKDW